MKPPILVSELELTESIPDIVLPERADGLKYEGVRLLVRLQGSPVGYAQLLATELDACSAADHVWRQVGSAVNARRARHGLPGIGELTSSGLAAEPGLAEELADRPPVSVVVCTRDRPESLVRTLRGLAALLYEPAQVIVVDNAPATELARLAFEAEFGADPRFRYVREPRPGSSAARNRGVAEATAEIIAFTDDDVIVDRWWLEGIVRGFGQADDVGCVTGLVRAACLDNAVQLYFDQREAWGASCERRIYDLADHRDSSPLYPYSAGVFGTGANFAMTRTVLRELGGFNEALGAGTLSGGGEDLDLFMRTVLSGHRLVYEPSAVVSHVHRSDLGDLARQMRGYGSGASAALTALLLRRRRTWVELPPKLVRGAVRIAAIGDRTKDNPVLPSGLIKKEWAGMLAGPWLYLRSRRQLRRAIRRDGAAAEVPGAVSAPGREPAPSQTSAG